MEAVSHFFYVIVNENGFVGNCVAFFAVNIFVTAMEYYTITWHAILYVLGFPIFVIMMVIEDWDYTKVKAHPYLNEVGLDSLQYIYLDSDWLSI